MFLCVYCSFSRQFWRENFELSFSVPFPLVFFSFFFSSLKQAMEKLYHVSVFCDNFLSSLFSVLPSTGLKKRKPIRSLQNQQIRNQLILQAQLKALTNNKSTYRCPIKIMKTMRQTKQVTNSQPITYLLLSLQV